MTHVIIQYPAKHTPAPLTASYDDLDGGWTCEESPAFARLLTELPPHPKEAGYYPGMAWRFADRARLVLGARILSIEGTPTEPSAESTPEVIY